MVVRNAKWRAEKDDKKDLVTLYRQGEAEPVLSAPVEEFIALRAIVDQVIKG